MNRRTALLFTVLLALAAISLPASTAYLPIDEIKPGMTGVGITVFEGTQRTEFKVHIIGVLQNMMGPRRNLILARLEGGPLADTGVIAGMSGSPVYVDGRLVGAVSYSLGAFSKEPIAGITPIAEMTEAVSLPERRAPVSQKARMELLGGQGFKAVLGEIFAGIRVTCARWDSRWRPARKWRRCCSRLPHRSSWVDSAPTCATISPTRLAAMVSCRSSAAARPARRRASTDRFSRAMRLASASCAAIWS
jgi:hypothetical protein